MTSLDRHYFSLAVSHTLMYLLLVTGIIAAIACNIVPWPVKPIRSPYEGYRAVIGYLPVLVIPLLSTFWIWGAKLDIKKFLRPQLIHLQSSFTGMAIGLVYSLILYIFLIERFRGPVFWPPVLILCLLNAFAEEFLFRFIIFELWEKTTLSETKANIIQALLYASVHYFIAGPLFCILSFLYGLLLGYIYQKNRNILPLFISHFLIDLGGIGAIMLHY